MTYDVSSAKCQQPYCTVRTPVRTVTTQQQQKCCGDEVYVCAMCVYSIQYPGSIIIIIINVLCFFYCKLSLSQHHVDRHPKIIVHEAGPGSPATPPSSG
jgi:hypothetical protein